MNDKVIGTDNQVFHFEKKVEVYSGIPFFSGRQSDFVSKGFIFNADIIRTTFYLFFFIISLFPNYYLV